MNNFSSSTFLDKVRKAICDYSMIEKSDRILVALSGGADSCALLVCLKMLSSVYNFSLSALHINHGIRGQEADRDMFFSKALCEKYDIPFFCEHCDIPALSKMSGLSLELTARNERYIIFEKVCKDNGFEAVALAHTASDNAETVIFNLTRGSSISGLCGIPAKRVLYQNVNIIRPLIFVTRSEVEMYLEQCNQDFITDSTNNSDDYTRNYIRHNIIPSLKSINPSIENTLTATSVMLKADSDFLDSFAKANCTDSLEVLKTFDDAVLSRVIKLLYAQKFNNTLENVHISSIISLIRKTSIEKSHYLTVSLPSNTMAIIQNKTLRFESGSNEHNNCDFSFKAQSGLNIIPNSKFALHFDFDSSCQAPDFFTANKNIYKKYNTVSIYFDRLKQEFLICSRPKGSTFFLNGHNHLVKRLLNAHKVPVTLRKNLPFIKIADDIAYIPFVSVCDKYKNFSDKARDKADVSFYIQENSFPRSNL